jgi:hypothetical protein
VLNFITLTTQEALMKSLPSFSSCGRFLSFFALLISICVSLSAQAAIVIDDFTISQTQTGGVGGTATGSNIIGGERDVTIYESAAVYINSTYGSGGHFINMAVDPCWGYAHLAYDGPDGSISNYDYSGLGHVDLTGGGQYNGFLISLTQINGIATMSLTVNQGDSEAGYEYFELPTQPQNVFVPFADFGLDFPCSVDMEYIADYTLVDFADVGYIGLHISLGPNSSCTIGSITVVPEPASLAILLLGGLILRKRK